jgi:hypothetical protein
MGVTARDTRVMYWTKRDNDNGGYFHWAIRLDPPLSLGEDGRDTLSSMPGIRAVPGRRVSLPDGPNRKGDCTKGGGLPGGTVA